MIIGYVNLAQSKAGHYVSLACALIGAIALFAVDCFEDGRKGRRQEGQVGPAGAVDGGQNGQCCNAGGRSSNAGGGEHHLLTDMVSDAGAPGGRQSAGSVGGTVFGGGANGAAAAGLWLQQQQGIHQVTTLGHDVIAYLSLGGCVKLAMAARSGIHATSQ